LRRNWTTPVILLGIFLVALYLRAYFPWDLAIQDRLLSGGSDAFYYERIVNHCAETGTQLVFDPRLAYPMGLTNPRPPLFSWTTCVAGEAVSPFFGSEWEAVTVVFLSSTAVWGALTIIPLYFLTKEAFGRRAAYLASFFLAIMPAHLQRSAATNGDHDAMVLFFVVTGFYFFLRSLKSLNEKRWVEAWQFRTKEGRAAIRSGLLTALRENRTSTLYALLAGWSLTVVALTWQGWAYAPIIILLYFLFQVLVHRFRNQDTLGILAMFVIALGVPLLVAFPWYFQMRQIGVWYDVPLYLYLAAIALGVVFTVTRDYPWALVIPLVVIVSGGSLFVASLFSPSIANAFISGAGYFVPTKAYSTIAEAQPPGISQVILSFGVATYFMSLFGLLWMARGFPKRPTPDYLFVVVWAIAAIFMANAAARFIFNAAPAFAMTSAWVTVLLVEWLRFDEMRKTFRSLAGSRFAAFRRSVKVRHVIASLLIVFIILLPNVWFGVDASIPFEKKSRYDEEVYAAFPDFLKPAGYQAARGSFFFGAFGYSLPLEKEYFPAAWAWFRTQDADVHPVENRPAFLSWWDYGFEAVDVGAHPTVADNFLDGYQLAGSFITAQGEEEAVALLDLRLLEGDFWANGRRFGADTRAVLTGMGVPWGKLEDAFRNPAAYTATVEDDPLRYGRYERVQPLNAQYIYGRRVLMDALDADGLTSLNRALREITGRSIRYFAVDTRLFPLDGQNTGIFYAPAKLSDHRVLEMRDGRTIPYDFFDVMATTSNRGSVNLKDVTPEDQVTALTLRYKDMFYNSMFYRAYIGFPPQVVGQTCTDCVPGLPSPTNQQMAQIQPMQAWNLSHFKLVYKTAYYNPFPAEEIANHTDAWQAMEWNAAQELQGKINRGNATGVVDLSAGSAIRNGIVVVKYYDGAFLNGTVRLDGVPWPGVRVTVHDELGVPHDTAVTGADGRYSVLLPFGTIHVQSTVGTPDNRTLVGPTTVNEFTIEVSDAAAMREDVDADGDGLADWRISRDIDVDGETLDGTAYIDIDGDGVRDANEPALNGANVTLFLRDGTLSRSARVAPDGHVFVPGLYAGDYAATVVWETRTLTVTNVAIAKDQGPRDLAVTPAILQGFVLDPTVRTVAAASVILRDTVNGTTLRATTAANGSFAFLGLLPGAFEVDAFEGTRRALPERLEIASGADPRAFNVTVRPAGTVDLQTSVAGAPQGFVTVTFEQRSAAGFIRVVTSDSEGRASVVLPAGTWDVHARHFREGRLFAFVGYLTIGDGDSVAYTTSLDPGATVGGRVFERGNPTATLGNAHLVFRTGAGELHLATDSQGRYLTHLPLGTYEVQLSYSDFTFNGERGITADTTLDIEAERGIRIEGTILRAFPSDGTPQIEDRIEDATVTFFDATREYRVVSATDGTFDVALPGQGLFALRVEHPGYEPFERPAATPSAWRDGARFSLRAREISISGVLRLDGSAFEDATLPVVFRGLIPGALTATAMLDGTGGYTASLAPGRYAVEVDRDLSGTGDRRLQLKDDLRVEVPVGSAPVSLDLELAVRALVDGTVRLSGQPITAVVQFQGPDLRSANASGGSFTTYLALGAYTVTANITSGGRAFLALQTLNVAGPTTVTVSLLPATNVTGTTRYQGSPVGGIPVTFTRAGGESVTTTSEEFGAYHVLVLGGTYTIRVDHVATAAEGAATRHVRYSFTATLIVTQGGSGFLLKDIDLDRALENTTVTGQVTLRGVPVAAQITFLAQGAGGMNATATAPSNGRYTVAPQPGSYDVYAFAPLERGAYLGTLALDAGPARTFDLALEAGLQVTGATTRGVAPVAANLTLKGESSRIVLRTDVTGRYDVFLPAATYDVQASSVGSERGVAVTYRATSSLPLVEPTVLNLQLTKVVRRGVEISWDEAQGVTIAPGASVVYRVIARNTGNEDDTVALSATSADFSFSFRDERVTIPFGATGSERTLLVTITAKADARVDHAPISVTIRSIQDETAVASVAVQLGIERFLGLTATVSSAAPVWDGRFLNYTLEVRNTGNGAETYRLELPNVEELEAAGWRATLVSGGGTPATSLTLAVAANSTERPVLRLERAGGAGGTVAKILVENVANAVYQTTVTVALQTPVLAVEGGIRAGGGTGVSTAEPGIDLATGAFLVSLVALIAAAAYLAILRRRSR